ncbi:hypothetical protein CR513_03133, partial [Mucuna pruriens]
MIKEPTHSGKSKKGEKSEEPLLVGPMEVKKVLLAKREPLYALPTNMMLYAYSSSVISLPTSMKQAMKKLGNGIHGEQDFGFHIPCSMMSLKDTIALVLRDPLPYANRLLPKIPHVEFSYNRVSNTTTSHSPFELAYGFNSFSPLDLFPLPIMPNYPNDEGLSKAQFVHRLHEKARLRMEKKGEQYARSANKERKKERVTPTLEGPITQGRLRKIQEDVQHQLANLKRPRRRTRSDMILLDQKKDRLENQSYQGRRGEKKLDPNRDLSVEPKLSRVAW